MHSCVLVEAVTGAATVAKCAVRVPGSIAMDVHEYGTMYVRYYNS